MIGRLELLRLWRSRRPVIAAGTLVFFLGLMLVGFATYAETKTRGSVEFRYTFENESYFNGLTFALYTFYFGFLLVLPVFVAVEGGVQVAGDTADGTLHLVLARPVSKARIYFTKAAVAAASAWIATGLFLALTLAVGLFAVGWGDLDLYPGVLQMTDQRQHLEQAEALVRFALAWPAASLALSAPFALSLWVSTWVRSPVNAVATSVAAYLVLYVVSQIHFFEAMRPWLFTTHMAFWRGLFREVPDAAAIARDAARLAGFTALFLALGYRRFRRREEP